MHRKLITMALATLLAVPAFAQERVTVTTTDGNRVSGRFEDWNRDQSIVYVRVSQDDQRRIPMDQVARIEVEGGGSVAEPGAAGTSGTTGAAGTAGEEVLITRSGERLRGQLTNIEGGQGSAQEGEPRVVTFRTSAGERRIPMSDVAVLELGRVAGRSSGNGAADLPQVDAPPGTIRVAANTRWTPTPLRVRQGERVQFDARGQIQLSTNTQDLAGTAGAMSGRKPGYGAPAPQFPAGALIGRVGENGEPFAIGDQATPLAMNGDGILYLGINDDEVSDNRGEFVVAARVVGRRR